MSSAQARIECIVTMVESIDEARERFERLGFRVLDAGYELGTRARTNMVAFPDGTALQFVERPSGLRARIRRRRV
ncbi:MAG: VOC family protein, partial [Spirochaetota bacterium]